MHSGRGVAYPFASVFAAITYYLRCNPARQKAINLLEPEFGSKPSHEDFTGYFGGSDTPRDLYAKVTHSLNRALHLHPSDERRAFQLYHFERLPADRIAASLGYRLNNVYAMIRRVREEFKRDLIAHGLLEPEVRIIWRFYHTPEDFQDFVRYEPAATGLTVNLGGREQIFECRSSREMRRDLYLYCFYPVKAH